MGSYRGSNHYSGSTSEPKCAVLAWIHLESGKSSISVAPQPVFGYSCGDRREARLSDRPGNAPFRGCPFEHRCHSLADKKSAANEPSRSLYRNGDRNYFERTAGVAG